MAKVVRWEGAAERLKPGYCLTLLSEATRKFLGKRPADGQRLAGTRQKAPQGRRGAFEARLLNVVLCEAIRNLWARTRQMAKVLRWAAGTLQKAPARAPRSV